MRKALFYSGAAGLCLGARMTFDLVRGLRHHGLDATWLMICDSVEHPPRQMVTTTLAIDAEPWWRVITRDEIIEETRNFLDEGGDIVFDWNADFPYKSALIQRISVLSDAPFSKLPQIQANLAPHAGLTTVDMNHAIFLRDFGIENRQVFVPHGGASHRPTTPLKKSADRNIPILFVGNLQSRPDRDFINTAVGPDTEPVVRDIFMEAVDRASDGVEPYLALRSAAMDRSINLLTAIGPKMVLAMTSTLATWIESNRRLRLLSSLRSHPVHVAGQIGAGFFNKLPDNIVSYGLLWGNQVLSAMQNARITLNTVGVFPGGSHERIWYAMHAGSLVATDHSDFLSETFEDGRDIIFLDQPEDADTILSQVLEDPEKMDRMTAEALEIYLEHHTWQERAGRIVRGFDLT